MYSHTARSFVRGTDAIESFVDSEEGGEFWLKNQNNHRVIALYSPWVGSLWEGIIRVVKY